VNFNVKPHIEFSHMIEKEKAIAAAEEILDIERSRLVELQNARAPRVPASLWVRGLSSLEPRHQAALLREAEKTVQAAWAFNAWAVAWITSVAIVWYFSSAGQATFGLLWATAPALGVLGLRRWFIRRALSRLVSAPSSREAIGGEV